MKVDEEPWRVGENGEGKGNYLAHWGPDCVNKLWSLSPHLYWLYRSETISFPCICVTLDPSSVFMHHSGMLLSVFIISTGRS